MATYWFILPKLFYTYLDLNKGEGVQPIAWFMSCVCWIWGRLGMDRNGCVQPIGETIAIPPSLSSLTLNGKGRRSDMIIYNMWSHTYPDYILWSIFKVFKASYINPEQGKIGVS